MSAILAPFPTSKRSQNRMTRKRDWQRKSLQTFKSNTCNCLKMHHMQTHAGIKSM